MGSWGYAALEDDTSLDFIGEFSDSPSVDALEEALNGAIGSDFIDDYSAPRALAAAEVVAAMNGKPFATLDDTVKTWASAQSAAPDLKQLAVQAVSNVFDASELREIWEDSDALDPWGSALDELKQRLV